MSSLSIYNSISRKKELFEPLTPGYVGMYVCGPTVYSDVHLGNCRTFISFDMMYRYFLHLGYKVRYVRNITDAGHLEGDRDEGDDKFSKKARLEQLEPMEIVQRYTLGFHKVLELFNTLPPSIEPTATGHIAEQIEMVKKILHNGYAYEINGTVYFDVEKYNREKPYGILTNRKLEELLENTRDLGGQEEKKGRLDFALWIKAKPEHLMQWPSPWGMGFPGWHIECSAMSKKYLGNEFDIHGGGMDLAATHHTNEIAQSQACNHVNPARYWIHTNMLTVNGARMSKSAGNGFLPGELFTGNHPLLEKAYSPMTVRFFMMQTHYRSTLDFSNEALQAAEKGFRRLWEAYENLQKFAAHEATAADTALDSNLQQLLTGMDDHMNDDFNTAKVLANMFEIVPTINSMRDGGIPANAISGATLQQLKDYFKNYLEQVLGLRAEVQQDDGRLNSVLQLLVEIRKEARAKKDYATSDTIRNRLTSMGIMMKDEKDGSVTISFA
ncbi:MAG: cysteine--tRNA ligase [Bacteroidota bacterium]|nr:cysteine--tRNA ligase [Bacteroidota bacterium]